MYLRRLRLTDYRNLATADLALDAQFTVLHGHNGAGKTNVLEAVYLVGTLRSFRTSDARTLVRRGQPGARVELEIDDAVAGLRSQLAVRLEQTPRAFRRVATLDGKTIRAAKDFYGRVRCVLFTPEDLAVVRGSPSGRRQFLDRVVFARDRAHIADVQSYEKLLRSRNRVLKDESLPNAQRERLLDTYDVGLAEVGAKIWTRRSDAVDAVREGFVAAFGQIHGTHLETALTYRPRVEGATSSQDERQDLLMQALTERRPKDLVRRTTGTGPHLDDLEVVLDGEPAADFASQGQTRALILAFKIAELRAARTLHGAPPLLLLDDVSSELDPGRNAQLFHTLTTEVGQCLLTTTAPDFVRLPGTADRRDIPVSAGALGPGANPANR